MARNHDPHDRLMALRNQVTWDKSSIRILEHRVDELKTVGANDLIRSLHQETDIALRRIQAAERQIKDLEMRLFGK